MTLAKTPKPPYYAVIFSSVFSEDTRGYQSMSESMIALANEQDGFLGIESAREEVGITVSYWRDLNSIKLWKDNVDHLTAQSMGKEKWYAAFKVRITKVEREYSFLRS